MEWKPIQTAPKDGYPILGSGECDGIMSCVFIMYWDQDEKTWLEYTDSLRLEVVNAWMPLPEPSNA
jgi:hypothetical protein